MIMTFVTVLGGLALVAATICTIGASFLFLARLADKVL
jgi:hypothetical protein